MPKWAGRWKGGRYYLDEEGRKTFFIERRVAGRQRGIQLKTHDEELAKSELHRFELDPAAYVRALAAPPPAAAERQVVYITQERIELYLAYLRKKQAVEDHRAARRTQLAGWANYRDAEGRALDLLTVDRRALRVAIASFDGGYDGRVEALNAFSRFLVREGDLPSWRPFEHDLEADPENARAEQVAYSLEQLEAKYRRLKTQRMRDVFLVRVLTGMHYTEIQQLVGAKIYSGPLPDRGVGIRILDGSHEIAGVLQYRQKTKPRHRTSVNRRVLQAVMRLRESCPNRISVYKAFAEDPAMVPSNLRHTYITLGGEVGEIVSYKGGGVPLEVIQELTGHRIGSKVTKSSYDKMQVPPMMRFPLKLESKGDVAGVEEGRSLGEGGAAGATLLRFGRT